MGSLRPPTSLQGLRTVRTSLSRVVAGSWTGAGAAKARVSAVISPSDWSIRWRSKVSLADYCVICAWVACVGAVRVCARVRAVVAHPARGHTRSPPTWQRCSTRGPRFSAVFHSVYGKPATAIGGRPYSTLTDIWQLPIQSHLSNVATAFFLLHSRQHFL